MNILVTGGAGFIGSHVSEKLVELGETVTVIDNLCAGVEENLPKTVRFCRMGIEDSNCEEIFKNGSFDTVIHLAAQVSVGVSIERPIFDATVNIIGLINILDLSRRYGVKKFIFASSAAVYGDKNQLPIRETEELDPKSPYGISKKTGELYSLKWEEIYGLETLCFRFSNVYGPRQGAGQDGSVIPGFIEKAYNGKPLRINGDGEQSRDFVYVEDVAAGIIAGIYSGASGVYNLSSNSRHSLNELINLLKKHLPEFSIEYGPDRLGDIRHSMLDNFRARHDFSWEISYGLDEGLKKTCMWYNTRKTCKL